MSSSNTFQIDARGRNAFNTSIAFDAVAAVFVIGRCIARFGMVRICGADDVLIMFAFVAAITFTALVDARKHRTTRSPKYAADAHSENQRGLGRHYDALSPAEQVGVMKVCTLLFSLLF